MIVWETESGREAARFEALDFIKQDWDNNNHPYGGIRCMAFTPDSQSLVLAGMENTDVAIIWGTGLVQIFNWQAGRKIYEKKSGTNIQFECLFIHPQSAWLLVAPGGSGGDGKLCFLDAVRPQVLRDANATMPTFGLTVNETANAFYTVGRGKALKWEFRA